MSPAEAVVALMAERHPDVLALVEMEAAHLAGRDELVEPIQIRWAERVVAFLQAATFGTCQACYRPVVSYPNGVRLDWPELTPHSRDCVMQDPLDETTKPRGAVARPVEQRPFKPTGEGSTPSRPTTMPRAVRGLQ